MKSRGEFRPSVLEIEVEEEVYVVSLWWECRPMLRRNRREEVGRQSIKVRGDAASRTEQRVAEERVSVRLETLNLSDEGTGEQGVGSGRVRRRQTKISTRQPEFGPQPVNHYLGRIPQVQSWAQRRQGGLVGLAWLAGLWALR